MAVKEKIYYAEKGIWEKSDQHHPGSVHDHQPDSLRRRQGAGRAADCIAGDCGHTGDHTDGNARGAGD